MGADDRGEIRQRDTYFAGARGRLKLREQDPGAAELIAYRRADVAAARESSYRVVPVPDPGALRDALTDSLALLVVVQKTRRLLLWEGVRIHLDDVEGLGSFVELEAVAGEQSDMSGEAGKLERLRAELGIEDAALERGSYSDLLLDGPEALLRAAEAAMRNAYVPYSRFPVGAALRASSGAIHVGANVENAAYPQGWCAEASAIGAMATAGDTRIVEVAVVAERMEICPPCGGCRQRLAEFAGPGTPVHLGRPGGARESHSLAELLPLSFDLEPPAR
jgi:homotetrameric cytidine deaminase